MKQPQVAGYVENLPNMAHRQDFLTLLGGIGSQPKPAHLPALLGRGTTNPRYTFNMRT